MIQGENMSSIGFIGAGNMAQAIINGIIQAGQFAPADVMVSDISGDRIIELFKKYVLPTPAGTVMVSPSSVFQVCSMRGWIPFL